MDIPMGLAHATHIHLLTFSCYQKRRLFRHDDLNVLFEHSLVDTLVNTESDCLAYVIMPSHVHLLAVLPDTLETSVFTRTLKRPFSFKALEWFAQNEPSVLEWLTVKHGQRTNRRFWQAGGGYNRVLETDEEIRNAINYCHENPVRAGLVEEAEDWPWSSASYYVTGKAGRVPIHRPEHL